MLRLSAIFTFCLLAKAAPAQVVINEIGIAPASVDGEFVELYNRSGCTVDIGCYILVFSSTSGGGNPTGWTVKIPAGKLIAPGGYFLIGGLAGTMGVTGGTGYPTGGAVTPYGSTADLDVGTTTVTSNSVYMKQTLRAGTYTNGSGQLTLLDATGNVVASVSYNNGNNPGTYPLNTYTTCQPAGNTQGINNVSNPGNAVMNVNNSFAAAGNQGIYLNATGTYRTESSLTPGASNTINGGSQICSGPVLTNVTNASVCYSPSMQTTSIFITASNSPATYSLAWDAMPLNVFTAVADAALLSSTSLTVKVPAGTAPGIYTGRLTLANSCGFSCTLPFTITVNALPVVSAGGYSSVCANSGNLILMGTPAGGVFNGAHVLGNTFTPPAITGHYSVTYSYTDMATSCINTASTTIPVASPANTFTTTCTTALPYLFLGRSIADDGLHTLLMPNANGCTDTVRLYLTVLQTANIDLSGCDSVLYGNIYYYNNTILTETFPSVVTGCDSLIRTININLRKSTSKDTTVCLPPGGSLTLPGQTFTASGNYILQTTNAAGCDSIIRLRLMVAESQTVDTTGCDSIRYNGATYYANATFLETVPSAFTGCDSVIRTMNITIKKSTLSYSIACVDIGGSYLFNGLLLTASGLYSAAFTNTKGCDSTAQLHLVVAKRDTVTLRSCRPVVFNGISYTSSVTLQQSIQSAVVPCDSILRTINIIIVPTINQYLTVCVAQGQSYSFNGQVLTATGNYTAQYNTNGCDSIIHLYLLVGTRTSEAKRGCGNVVHNGTSYHTSTTITDTTRSIATGCDSITHTIYIQVDARPAMTISGRTAICKGDTATLFANVSNGTVMWGGYGTINPLQLIPPITTTYIATVTDTNGCINTASLTVLVDSFNLVLQATPNPALQGKPVELSTHGSVPYSVTGWQPAAFFPQQRAKSQRVALDSSTVVTATAMSTSGCRDTASIAVKILPYDDVYVPTAFTPNGDGKNETLRVSASGFTNMRFSVYNRWGQAVFTTADRNKGWNGMLNGIQQPADVYVWVLQAKKQDGRLAEKKGTVMLVR